MDTLGHTPGPVVGALFWGQSHRPYSVSAGRALVPSSRAADPGWRGAFAQGPPPASGSRPGSRWPNTEEVLQEAPCRLRPPGPGRPPGLLLFSLTWASASSSVVCRMGIPMVPWCGDSSQGGVSSSTRKPLEWHPPRGGPRGRAGVVVTKGLETFTEPDFEPDLWPTVHKLQGLEVWGPQRPAPEPWAEWGAPRGLKLSAQGPPRICGPTGTQGIPTVQFAPDTGAWAAGPWPSVAPQPSTQLPGTPVGAPGSPTQPAPHSPWATRSFLGTEAGSINKKSNHRAAVLFPPRGRSLGKRLALCLFCCQTDFSKLIYTIILIILPKI